jgi:tRNA G46 methylase TrmB
MQRYNSVFRQLFSGFDPSEISKNERQRKRITGLLAYTYGEIIIEHIFPVFELIELKADSVFWDIGCGAGKCLIAAAMAYPHI